MKPSRSRAALLVGANALGALAFAWPFLVAAVASEGSPSRPNPLLLGVALVSCVGMALLLELSRGGMGPKAVALIAVLAACMVVLRLPGFVAGFSAMFIVVLVAGNAFGPGFGFLLGALGTFASALFVGGLGPWLPFQMAAVGWVGGGAGVVPRRAGWAARVGLLAAYAFVASYLFGALMNLWFWPFQAGSSALGWAPGAGAENVVHYARFYVVTSLAWDTFRAVGSAALVLVAGRPLLATLDRAARRMRLELRDLPSPLGPGAASS